MHRGALGRSFGVLLGSDKPLPGTLWLQPEHLAVIPRNLLVPGGRGELGVCAGEECQGSYAECLY